MMSAVATQQPTIEEGQAAAWSPPIPVKEANPNRPWRRTFLAQLRSHGSATEAARIAGVSLPYVYRCRKASRQFAERWADALSTARRRKVDAAESRLKHLAVDGYDDPVYQNGELVGHKRKYSVEALKTLLGAEHPRKYARKASAPQSTTVAITIDARQAFLRDPRAIELACELDERLALTRGSHDGGEQHTTLPATPQPTQPATIDISPPGTDAPTHYVASRQHAHPHVVASNPATLQPRKPASPVAPRPSAWEDEPWDDEAIDPAINSASTQATPQPSRGA